VAESRTSTSSVQANAAAAPWDRSSSRSSSRSSHFGSSRGAASPAPPPPPSSPHLPAPGRRAGPSPPLVEVPSMQCPLCRCLPVPRNASGLPLCCDGCGKEACGSCLYPRAARRWVRLLCPSCRRAPPAPSSSEGSDSMLSDDDPPSPAKSGGAMVRGHWPRRGRAWEPNRGTA